MNLSCAVTLLVLSGAVPNADSPSLRDLSKQIDTVNSQTPSSEVENLRKVLLVHVERKPTDAAVALGLLWRLPPRKAKKPLPPRFPFDAVTARQYQKDYADWAGLPVTFQNSVRGTFILIPPGTFRIGSPPNEVGHMKGAYDEMPTIVTLSRPVYVSKYETTVGEFKTFVRETKYATDAEKNNGGNAHDELAVWKNRPGTNWLKPGFAGPYTQLDSHAVVHMSFNDIRAYHVWLNRKNPTAPGWEYNLPSEAQWEWACRGGSDKRFWWGDEEDTTGKKVNVGDTSLKKVHEKWPRAVWDMDDGHAYVAPVGSYRANPWGLHDTIGNVWEFCSTHSGPYPQREVVDLGHIDPRRGFATRGGGWSNVTADVRCAVRSADPPAFCHSNLGFRSALLLPPHPSEYSTVKRDRGR